MKSNYIKILVQINPPFVYLNTHQIQIISA